MISNAFAGDVLKLIFNGEAIAGLADNAVAGPLGSLYLSLHTADPGADGNQGSSEVAYTGYARMPVSRDGAGFTVNDAAMHPATVVEFGQMTAGEPALATHLGIGTAESGAGKLLFRLPLTAPGITLNVNTTPRIRATSELSVVTGA